MRLVNFEELALVSGGGEDTPQDGGSIIKGEGGKSANCPVGSTPIVIKATGGIELGLPGGFTLKTSGGVELVTCWPKSPNDKESSAGSITKPKPSTPPQP